MTKRPARSGPRHNSAYDLPRGLEFRKCFTLKGVGPSSESSQAKPNYIFPSVHWRVYPNSYLPVFTSGLDFGGPSSIQL